jgi:glycolate oxidase FAD binding subunit
MTLIARTGTPISIIEDALAAEGQSLAFEPPDTATLIGSVGIPTIGGMVATNASGPRRIRTGACRDHLLGVRFVDGNGRMMKSGGRVMKNVTGLDLTKLLCGSFGQLGVLTEVALKTLPVAPCQATLAFHDVNAANAINIFTRALATPYEISGAAYYAGTAFLRIEGHEQQVAYRRIRVQELLADSEPNILPEADSRAVWKRLRDMAHFHGLEMPLWRILVKPSEAAPTVAALEDLGGITSIDWGGALIWYCGGADAVAVRTASGRGYATLVRRGKFLLSEMFAPLPAKVAALSAGLRKTFDPAGILNPGLARI